MLDSAYPIDLYEAALAVLHHSYSPYSEYKVACALRTEAGDIFAGCNVENAAYGLTQCAEASAIGAMVTQKTAVAIADVLILVAADEPASPCGACRQRLMEFALPEATVHMCSVSGAYRVSTMQALLPLAFDL